MNNYCRIHILTLFPDLVDSYLQDALLSKAIKQGLIQVSICNLRQFSLNSYKSVDDKNYGGADGAVIQAEVLYRAMCSIKIDTDVRYHVVYLSPQGEQWTSKKAREYAKRFFVENSSEPNKDDGMCIKRNSDSRVESDFKREELILICGRYAGVDQRFIRLFVNEEISIGDYILSGGELASLVLVESLSRFIPGVLGCMQSAFCDSFEQNLLEAPQFTKPQLWNGYQVPEVLLSGNHLEIERWKQKVSLLFTLKKRPDLLFSNFNITSKDSYRENANQLAFVEQMEKINFSELYQFWTNMKSDHKDMLGLTELDMGPIWKKIHEDFNET